jgi:hypothetical protein
MSIVSIEASRDMLHIQKGRIENAGHLDHFYVP